MQDNPESFPSKVRRVFVEAVYLPKEERSAFLEDACKNDQELYNEVVSLLAADDPPEASPHAMGELLYSLEMDEVQKESIVGELLDKMISRYKILEEIGEGGMSIVLKARDTQLNRIVALKFLAFHLISDEQFKKRFLREAQAVATLDHPNICYIHEINETEAGQLYIAMAYYEGKTLRDILAEGPLPEDQALDYFIQVLQGLSSAHTAGIIHRDLKPANVIITTEGVAKIIDFGLAKIDGATQITRKGSKVGTPIYMSPEQVLDTGVDHRSDIWAAGILLYEMLSGKHPFLKESDLSTIHSLMNDEVAPLEMLPLEVRTELEQIVHKALSKDLTQRYQQVDEMIKEIEHYRNRNIEKAGLPEQTNQQSMLRIMVYVGAALFVVLMFYSLWLFLD